MSRENYEGAQEHWKNLGEKERNQKVFDFINEGRNFPDNTILFSQLSFPRLPNRFKNFLIGRFNK
ncbi:hypothetical protein KKG48_01365 [Patescibacteria group bacterium]|nr:hypothetical protein [Patescibacteria group bacterium]MCG2694511.1 hypothetical protein [Candidatus Parcubacteria bacterium]